MIKGKINIYLIIGIALCLIYKVIDNELDMLKNLVFFPAIGFTDYGLFVFLKEKYGKL